MRPRSLLILAVVLVTVTVSLTTGAAGAHPVASVGLRRIDSAALSLQAARTTKSNVLPVNPKSHLLKNGYRISRTIRRLRVTCQGSIVVEGASRCFAGNIVYDPCWPFRFRNSDVSGDVCAANAWSHKLTRLTYGGNGAGAGGRGRALWDLRMRSGAKCGIVTGAGGNYHGKAIHFYCTNGDGLAGNINKSHPQWTITEVRFNKNYKPIGSFRGHITHAWYALGYEGA